MKVTPAEARNIANIFMEMAGKSGDNWWEDLAHHIRDQMRKSGVSEQFIINLE